MLKRAIYSFILGFLSTIAMMIPLVGLPSIIVATPVLAFFPKTGPHVEYVFASVGPRSALAWFIFVSYFSAFWYALFYMVSEWKNTAGIDEAQGESKEMPPKNDAIDSHSESTDQANNKNKWIE